MKNTRRVLYRRQLMLFLSFSFVLVVLLSVLVMTSYRSASERQVRETINTSLDQIEYQARFVSERAIYVALSFYDSTRTAAYLYEGDTSPLSNVAALRDMRERLAAHPFLGYAALYNRATGLLGTGAREESDQSPVKIVETLESAGAQARRVLVRVLEPNAPGTEQERVISYVYSEGSLAGRYETATIVDVPFRAQVEHVMSGQAASHRASLLFVPEYDVVYPEEWEELANSLRAVVRDSDRGITEVELADGTALAGHTIDRSTGVATIVLYDLRELRQTSLALQRQIAIISVVVLAGGWTLALFLTRYSYLPIQNLLDRVDPEHFYNNVRQRLDEMEYLSTHFSEITEQVAELRSESVERSSIFRELVLRSILLGEPLPLGYERAVRPDEAYSVLLISAGRATEPEYWHEHVRNVADRESEDSAAVVFVDARTTVLLKPAPRVATQRTTNWEHHTLGILNSGSPAGLYAFSIGGSTPVSRLGEAYKELSKLRRYQLFYETPRLVTPELVREHHTRIAPYDPDAEKELLEMMRFDHANRHQARIRMLCESFADCTYQSVVSVLLQLALAHGRAIDEADAGSSMATDAVALARSAERWTSFEDVLALFDRLFGEFRIARQQATGAIRTQALRRMEEAAMRIRENLHDPNLSVTMIASKAGMSRSHFSRQFKEYLGVSVNEFIARERIEMAQRLLVEGSETVEAIARQCGIQNTKYFFKLFKSHVGVTPAAYRASESRKNDLAPSLVDAIDREQS
ncbi:MAG: helix-turn-helix domain-containing protein [Spirochaetota bacterium]